MQKSSAKKQEKDIEKGYGQANERGVPDERVGTGMNEEDGFSGANRSDRTVVRMGEHESAVLLQGRAREQALQTGIDAATYCKTSTICRMKGQW